MLRFLFIFFILVGNKIFAQQITYSEKTNKDRAGEMAFEIIGKYNNNFLVYKNIGLNHYVTVYNNDLTLNDNIKLDFIPDKTINVDFAAYKNFFYLIYQYTKKNVVHCVAVKMDSTAKKLTEPKDIDTTNIGVLADNKIYTTVISEDKQKILVYKVHKKENKYSLATMLYNSDMVLQNKSRMMLDLDERRKAYSDLQVDNDGNLVFVESLKTNNREYIKHMNIITKDALSDEFKSKKMDTDEKYLDEVNIKVDNLNKTYLFNSFFYTQNRGSIVGLASALYSKSSDSLQTTTFTEFNEQLRDQAKRSGLMKFAFDDFFIRSVILKKDGSFILTAEDYSSQSRGNNNWNRWDYLYGNPYYSSYNSFNNPGYYSYYRPYGSTQGSQSVRYYYDNILILSMDKSKGYQWGNVIQKEQFDDDNESFLSFCTMVDAGQIHFLFNDNKSNQIINNHSINGKGEINRNPTLKSKEKGYQFLARYAKQTATKQMLMPCNYRGYICFAKIVF